MKLAVIIQARLSASRLPNKVMMDICGKPLLWHVVENARKVTENVIVATPDKLIADCAESLGIEWFLGSEYNVLDRYYQAAGCYEVDHIIRMTADNPLIDPVMVKQLIRFYFEGGYDWAANCRLKVTYPVGNDAEIFSFQTLEKAWQQSTDPYEAETVTAYIYRHPEIFKLGVMENKVDESHLRWTVDTMEDLIAIRKIIALQGERRRETCLT